MATVLGLNAKLMTKSGSHGDAGTWEVVGNVRDVTTPISATEADSTTRESGGWRQTQAALLEAEVSFETVWDDEDAFFTALRTAFLSRSTIALRVLDKTDGQGLSADFSVTRFEIQQPLEDIQRVAVTVKPGRSAHPPAWHTPS